MFTPALVRMRLKEEAGSPLVRCRDVWIFDDVGYRGKKKKDFMEHSLLEALVKERRISQVNNTKM